MDNKYENKKIYLFMAGVYEVFLFILCCHMGIYKKHHLSAGFTDLLSGGITHMREHFFSVFPITGDAWKYFAYATFVSLVAAALFYYSAQSKHVTMRGKEGGTAEWNKNLKKYNKKFTDPYMSSKSKLYPSNNLILAQDIYLNMDTRKTRQNNHILVIGGSGSGKSLFFIKPNILQFNTSIVVTDPAADILAVMGKALEKNGYKLKIFNTVDMAQSYRFNPFRYLDKSRPEEVLSMVDCLIENTSNGKQRSEDFWVNAERLLYQALCFYLLETQEEHPENQSWGTVASMLQLASVDENDASKESELDIMFNKLARENKESIAVSKYKEFKLGAGKTLKSILISCSVRLSVFDIPSVRWLTSEDDMDLYNFEKEKMAYFVIVSQTTNTYNFLSAMLYSTMFNVLYERGGKLLSKKKRFKYDIKFLLDEHANSGRIPRFPEIIATSRKYNVSISTVLQNIGQLNTLYDTQATSVSGNSDTIVYLGGNDYESAEYMSKLLGKRTIRTSSVSRSNGSKGSYSEQYQYTTRDLMSPDEIIRLPKDTCIVIPAGQKPFLAKKFDYFHHPNYEQTGDFSDDNIYTIDVEKIHSEIETRDKALKFDRKDGSIELIEAQMREAIKDLLGDVPEIRSLPELLESYEKMSDSDIFSQMSTIEVNVDLSEKEKAVVENETAKAILRSVKDSTAKEIIASFKEKNIRKAASSTGASSPDLNTIIDEIKATESDDIDEYTKMWF